MADWYLKRGLNAYHVLETPDEEGNYIHVLEIVYVGRALIDGVVEDVADADNGKRFWRGNDKRLCPTIRAAADLVYAEAFSRLQRRAGKPMCHFENRSRSRLFGDLSTSHSYWTSGLREYEARHLLCSDAKGLLSYRGLLPKGGINDYDTEVIQEMDAAVADFRSVEDWLKRFLLGKGVITTLDSRKS